MTNASHDERAFWRAIEGAPDDEQPRLVFADWLEEQGDPRAPWVRDPLVFRWLQPGVPSPVPRLLEELHAVGSEAAVEALVRVGAAAVRPLLALLADEENDDRWTASSILEQMDGAALRPFLGELVELLPTAGSLVTGVFRQIGPDVAPLVPALLALEASEQIDGDTLVQVLRRVGPAGVEAAPRIVELLFSGRAPANHVAGVLASIGPQALAVLLQRAGAVGVEGVRRGVGLTGLGPEVTPALIAALTDPHPHVRYVAALALAEPNDATALPVLLDALAPDQPTDEGLRADLVRAIGQIGAAAGAARPTLRRLLGNDAEPPELLEAAAAALLAVDGDVAAVELADHPHSTVRERVVNYWSPFVHQGPPARAQTVRALADPAETVRRQAVHNLAWILRPGDEDVVEPFRALLRDPNPEIRAGALNGLHRIRSAAEPAIPDVIAATRDEVANVRRLAAETLDGMQVERPEMLGVLLGLLDDPDESVRHAAAEGLANWTRVFPEHQAAVLQRVNDPDPVIRRGAVRLVGHISDATPELLAFYRTTLQTGETNDIRDGAAAGLGRARANEPEVVADLLAYLDDSESEAAARALAEVGALAALDARLTTHPDLRPAILTALNHRERENFAATPVEGITACLTDPQPATRERAAELLGWLGFGADAVLSLRNLAEDPEPQVRRAAVYALRAVRTDPVAVLPDLARALTDPDQHLRFYALLALSQLGVPATEKFAVAHLALRDADPMVRKQAAAVVGQAGPPAAPAVPDLIALLSDVDGSTRAHSAQALGQIGPAAAEACPALIRLLADPENFPRNFAAGAVGNLGPAALAAVPELLRLLTDDPDVDVSSSAAQSVAALGVADQAGAGVAHFRNLLRDPSRLTRGTAALALSYLGPAARAAVPDLLEALRDPTWGDVRAEVWKQHTRFGYRLLSDAALAAMSHDRRAYVAMALGAMGAEPGVLEGLRAAIDDADEMVRNTALSALATLRPASEALLRELAEHPVESVRRSATEALQTESTRPQA